MAGPGLGHGAGGAGGRCAAGELPCPWADRGGGAVGASSRRAHLRFDDTVAWLAVACSTTAVCELMRIAWRTVGAIVARVWADVDKTVDRFANLRRIGIDEISYKRHHKYLTIVVDHDTGTLIWAAAGRDTKTLRRFFDALGAERCKLITHVSADAAEWISDVVTERCPGAIRCADPFYAEVLIMPMLGGLGLVTAVTMPVRSA